MATDGIDIPSPSVFLRSDNTPPNKSTGSQTTSQSAKTKTALAQRPAAPVPIDHSVKPKQSKSRNGCITCKAKRLKCDEEKPGCQQCARRKVECGGYKKDFKWRPFEDSIVKINIDRAKNASQEQQSKSAGASPESNKESSSKTVASTFTEPDRAKARRLDQNATTQQTTSKTTQATTPPQRRTVSKGRIRSDSSSPRTSPKKNQAVKSPTTAHLPPSNHTQLVPPVTSPAALVAVPDIESTQSWQTPIPSARTTASISSLQDETLSYFDLDFHDLLPQDNISPTLDDLLVPLPDPDTLTNSFSDVLLTHDFSISGATETEALQGQLSGSLLDFTDNPSITDQQLLMLQTANWHDADTTSMLPDFIATQPYPRIDYLYSQPDFAPDSPEMLCLRFDRLTCGILSVMDGPTENPWRSLIWPLAQQSQALYHAVNAMTAYHSSTDIPALRLTGHRHKQKSIRYIQEGIRDNSMSDQTAIATALALGFSESWDQHTASGNTHIKGAQALVKRALAEHRKQPLQGEELARLKFLCNAWVYMDVIARLTAVDSDESNDFDNAFMFSTENVDAAGLGTGFGIDFGMPIDARLDPLMGCASTLFPLIGRVANLVKKVFRSRSNSPSVISQANDLKLRLETWEPPEFIEPPEDPTSQVQHALQTAEAYRWATILHLHQSVPELPSASSEELGQKVLTYLATVPLASRTVIVQIYPLMVAGCEASTAEDREWVRERWAAMNTRMRIGVIDKCITVVEEVWRRRDLYEAQPSHHQRRLVATADLQLQRSGSDSLKRPHSGFVGDAGAARKGLVFGWNGPDAEAIRDEPVIPERSNRSGIGSMDPAYTVRGQLHWVGVMFEYGWEVLLG